MSTSIPMDRCLWSLKVVADATYCLHCAFGEDFETPRVMEILYEAAAELARHFAYEAEPCIIGVGPTNKQDYSSPWEIYVVLENQENAPEIAQVLHAFIRHLNTVPKHYQLHPKRSFESERNLDPTLN